MINYKSGEFCEAIGCNYNKSRKEGKKDHCITECKAYEMHHFLEANGFEIVKKIVCTNEYCFDKKHCLRHIDKQKDQTYSKINIQYSGGNCKHYIPTI